MSSDYGILCLSHDPAILAVYDQWHRPEPALAAAADPASHRALRHHAGCDMLVGRYSAPLVEVCCPPSAQGSDTRSGHRGWHRDGQWVDAGWLRLLWHAQRAEAGTPLAELAGRVPGCWTPQRVNRLRYELDLVEAVGPAPVATLWAPRSRRVVRMPEDEP